MRFSEDKINTLVCSDGKGRPIHIWESPEPKALFLAIHGGMAHGGDFVTPAMYFKKYGITSIACDLHGHDLKKKVHIPGFKIFLDDLDLSMEWIKKKYPDLPIFIMGHSMGALIATHYELKRPGNCEKIKGFILSSPYYLNAIKTSAALVKAAGILSALVPRMNVPIEDISIYLTHDPAIAGRHIEDERDHIRASRVSARFANELLKAQKYIPSNIHRWSHPLFCVVAGNDRLANSEATLNYLEKIDKNLLTLHVYPDNYHENFNEVNREEIFENILNWIEPLI